MAAHLKINSKNAESIGTPIFDNIIQAFSNSDRDDLIQHFPELQDWMTLQLFDEVSTHLNTLGEVLSREYSTYSSKDDIHSLTWKTQYTIDENTVNWLLKLDDCPEGIKVHGFSYDR